MALMPYTDALSVRALLGISEGEVSDDVLEAEILESYLTLDLNDMTDPEGAVVSNYTDVIALDPGAMTSSQRIFRNCVKLYSGYSVAYHLTGMPNLILKKETDGKASGERFDKALEGLQSNLLAGMNAMRARLLKALGDMGVGFITPAVSTSQIAVSVGLAVDPITG